MQADSLRFQMSTRSTPQTIKCKQFKKNQTMEKLTSLGLQFDRILIQILVPGLVCIIPYFLIFLNQFQSETAFLVDNPNVLIFLVTIVGVIAGFILENIGSMIEVYVYDPINKKKFEDYESTWEKFLLLNYDGVEPIGHRYVRNILIRMKFELSMGIAIIPMAIGFVILDFQHLLISSLIIKGLLFYIIPLYSSMYVLIFEAYNSSKVLASKRKLLVDRYYRPQDSSKRQAAC